jgi:hypothetical protein
MGTPISDSFFNFLIKPHLIPEAIIMVFMTAQIFHSFILNSTIWKGSTWITCLTCLSLMPSNEMDVDVCSIRQVLPHWLVSSMWKSSL